MTYDPNPSEKFGGIWIAIAIIITALLIAWLFSGCCNPVTITHDEQLPFNVRDTAQMQQDTSVAWDDTYNYWHPRWGKNFDTSNYLHGVAFVNPNPDTIRVTFPDSGAIHIHLDNFTYDYPSKGTKLMWTANPTIRQLIAKSKKTTNNVNLQNGTVTTNTSGTIPHTDTTQMVSPLTFGQKFKIGTFPYIVGALVCAFFWLALPIALKLIKPL